MATPLAATALELDVEAEIAAICESVRATVAHQLRRRGAVVGVSGGVDSAVCAALCALALGNEHVVILLMPERDSSPESVELGQQLADTLAVDTIREDITDVLDAAGCARRQSDAIHTVFPDYGPGWKCKIVLPSILDGDRLNVARLVVEDPAGNRSEARLPGSAYRKLVAATNFKQRIRTMMEYFHADALHYAVCGTPNRLEYDLGFFVKGGDGLADFKPIAHLYKTQVYALGRALGVPAPILDRLPTTETFSLAQSQEEFYFSVPLEQLDLCLYAVDHGIAAVDVAAAVGLTTDQVARVFDDIAAKRRTTRPLHLPAQFVRPLGGS